MMNCQRVEKGVKVVLITDEFPGKTENQSLADTCDEADALASCGQRKRNITVPGNG